MAPRPMRDNAIATREGGKVIRKVSGVDARTWKPSKTGGRPLVDRQEPTIVDLPEMLPGETQRPYDARVWREMWHNARSKGDLEDWTGSEPFHLSCRENVK